MDARIFQGDQHVADFTRTRTGVRLQYLPGVTLQRGFLSTTTPCTDIETSDLPPFFLNLLPEGARLRLLLESNRSKDDALEVLLRVGWDTIGDVSILPPPSAASAHKTAAPEVRLPEVSFWDLFHQGISAQPDASIPGVQEKISSSTVAFGVRTANVPSAILKLCPERYPRLVQNEAFFMRVARSCGLDVASTHLVEDRDGEPGLLVQRFDRVKQGGKVHKLHVEDACQLLDAIPARKYDLSVREIAEALVNVCSAPKVEVLRLIELYVFSYLVGNGDLHAKNISVLWNGVVRLSPGYDLLSTLPYGLDRCMALKIDGKDDRFRAADFVRFAATFGVPERAVLHSISRIRDKAAPWMDRLEEIGFSSRVTMSLRRTITERIARLGT